MVGFPGGSVVKNPPANAGDVDSTPGSGRSPGEGNANHSSILAWEIPWTEESGGLQSMESQRVGHDLATNNIFSATWPLMSPHIDVNQRGKKGERGLWTLTITVIIIVNTHIIYEYIIMIVNT